MIRQGIDIIGVPIDLGASRRGSDAGPSALRVAGLSDSIQKMGYHIADDYNIPVAAREDCDIGNGNIRYKAGILDACRFLAEKTEASVKAGNIPLILGGDHSLSIGSISGIAKHFVEKNQDIGVIWFDAHADINIPDSSPSGNIHGMPLAHLLGYGDEDFINIMGFSPKIKPENVVLIGVRDIDAKERAILRASNITVYTMRDIDEQGMSAIGDKAVDIATRNTAGFHLSFDVDGCDPDVIPGSGTLVSGGVNFREAHLLLEKCADSRSMLSMDIVELNPFLDDKNISAERAVSLIQSAFGNSIV